MKYSGRLYEFFQEIDENDMDEQKIKDANQEGTNSSAADGRANKEDAGDKKKNKNQSLVKQTLVMTAKLELPEGLHLNSICFERNVASVSADANDDEEGDSKQNKAAAAALSTHGSTMYATTSAGNLWVYPAPLATSDFEEYFLHATKNKTMRIGGPTLCSIISRSLSKSSNVLLVTASTDGTVFLIEDTSFNNGKSVADVVLTAGQSAAASVCLVEKDTLQSYDDMIFKLKNAVKMAKKNTAQSMRDLKYDYEGTRY